MARRASAAPGSVRARVAPGITLATVLGADGDADHLLTGVTCRIVKFQRKVIVGRVEGPMGSLYVKRYNVFAWRVAVASLWRRSPAFRAWGAAATLRAHGFSTPEVVAATEIRRAGFLRRSFFVTREVPGAVTADRWWRSAVADSDPARGRLARRALARALGRLFRDLHAAGLYHNDLKDVNVLVGGDGGAPTCTLLDLERVRVLRRVGRRRRVKNLVQLARTLGREATAVDHARFLRAYLGEVDRRTRRAWSAAVLRGVAAKDRRTVGATPAVAAGPVSCMVVCQNEEVLIARCLESVAWCDEIVVVDGGSRDRTTEVARGFTDRVIHHPWPGYRAQKQFALDAARHPWVLNVDADERVTPELTDEIRHALRAVPEDVAGFSVPRLVCYFGRWWYRGGWYPRRVVRLVRRAATRWGGTDPHERAEVTGRVVPLAAPILHYSYADVRDHLRSANALTTVAARQVEVATRRVGFGRLVAEPAWRFVRSYVLRRGALEGLPGLFVAATDAFYVFVRWGKVREQRESGGAA